MNRYRIQLQTKLFKMHTEFESPQKFANPTLRKGTVKNHKKCAQISQMIIKQLQIVSITRHRQKCIQRFCFNQSFKGGLSPSVFGLTPPPPPPPHPSPYHLLSIIWFFFFSSNKKGIDCGHQAGHVPTFFFSLLRRV